VIVFFRGWLVLLALVGAAAMVLCAILGPLGVIPSYSAALIGFSGAFTAVASGVIAIMYGSLRGEEPRVFLFGAEADLFREERDLAIAKRRLAVQREHQAIMDDELRRLDAR
jgi:hypothetical protein